MGLSEWLSFGGKSRDTNRANGSKGPAARRPVRHQRLQSPGAESLEERRLLAGQAQLLKDLNTILDYPQLTENTQLLSSGGLTYFAAKTQAHGEELWRTDGTAAGTRLVADLQEGPVSAYPTGLVDFNGTLCFWARGVNFGSRLWKTDGTAAGTVVIAELPGEAGLYERVGAKAVGGNLYFAAIDASGIELWKTDGTAAGTVRVKDIQPGSEFSSSYPRDLTAANGVLYFSANHGVHGRDLWKSDGTEAGTVLVKDLPGGPYADPRYLTTFGGTLYFQQNYQMWQTDGTADGTVLYTNSALDGKATGPYAAVGGLLYFGVKDSKSGSFWRTDGTAAGTFALSTAVNGVA